MAIPVHPDIELQKKVILSIQLEFDMEYYHDGKMKVRNGFFALDDNGEHLIQLQTNGDLDTTITGKAVRNVSEIISAHRSQTIAGYRRGINLQRECPRITGKHGSNPIPNPSIPKTNDAKLRTLSQRLKENIEKNPA